MARVPRPRQEGIPKTPEDGLQIACVAWARAQCPHVMVLHIPNQGKRSKAYGGVLKAMGLKRGAPDLVVVLPEQRVIWIEMKTEAGTLDPDQRKIHAQLRERGHVVEVARSLDEFRQVFVDYGLWIPGSRPGRAT